MEAVDDDIEPGIVASTDAATADADISAAGSPPPETAPSRPGVVGAAVGGSSSTAQTVQPAPAARVDAAPALTAAAAAGAGRRVSFWQRCRVGCFLACTNCCPRSTSVVQATAILAVLGCFITLVFGRSLVAVLQSLLGILMGMETYHAAAQGKRWWLRVYALYQLLNTVASLLIGIVVLTGVDISCAGSSAQRDICASVEAVYGVMMALGATSVGLFAAINSCLASCAMPDSKPTDECEDMLLH